MRGKDTHCHFYGIISSNEGEAEVRPYRKYIQEHFKKDGGIIYIYSKKEMEMYLNYFKERWKLDFHSLYDNGNIILLPREDYFINNRIDKIGLKDVIKEGIDKLNEKSIENKMVFITVDSFWEPIIEEDALESYKTLRDISNTEKTTFIFRYIMEELSEKTIYSLLNNHEILLIDGIDSVEAYTPEALIHKSMTLLSKHSSSVYKYENEMLRLEYLKTLGELVEGTVHDINNLLITILGYAQYALSVEDKSDIEESLKIIQDTAMDGKNIIGNIQNHIRGSHISSRDFHKLDDIVESCIKMTAHKFKPCPIKQRIEMYMESDLNSNKYIYGNEYELRQVIINIISNGIDAIEGHGSLFIKTYDIDGKAVLEIEDTGIGMDELTLKKIFNPYFSTKGNYGTGLGLNLAKKVFENHGAEMTVESEIDKGTKFTIYFPTKEVVYKVAEIESKDYNII